MASVMLFDTGIFLAFFAIVYSLYLLLGKRVRAQNALLLGASYLFYGWWDWRFLSLIAISTVADFTIGQAMGRLPIEAVKQRRRLLLASVGLNLSILGFFKYFNFFAESFVDVLNVVGLSASPVTLNIVLPVGISFYTFQTMSYTFDIYRGDLEPTDNFINFATFVAFFPQLVAGPIERARNLLPQFAQARTISAAQVDSALFLIVWGYFKKMVIADRLGLAIVDPIFNNYTEFVGIDLFLAVFAFAFQIYCDFSAYSDIARGVARLMGFELMVNFRLPYFALNPSDFWNRWHISLSTWLRDYLYIPLGGNRHGTMNTYRNLFLTMLLGGLWHGAAWTFVLWGAYHGVILIIYRIFDRKPIHKDPWGGEYNYAVVVGKMLLMFTLTLIGWLIFRAQSVGQIVYFLSNVSLAASSQTSVYLQLMALLLIPLLIVQLWQYITRNLLAPVKMPVLARVPLYSTMIVVSLVYGVHEFTEFIYFQF